ncbi:MAG TPA: UDP-N-acetylmuramate--L-alanine ligase [Thermoanaerobaculia bacterium]|nr:UDP-N-acetylmuramate--L-alanine ligase [Thermoanaerobaculia bacterium]
MMFRHFAGLSRVHFVGVGGAGMSGLAEVLLDYDVAVSGSDLAASEATERLAQLGARIFSGHQPGNIEGADLVVISSAVPETNPEVQAARRQGVPVVRRAEMLAEVMRLKYGIAVAGAHGKTTTTSLVGHLLTDGGLDPTVIVGGRLRVSGTGARLGKSDYLVAEADEFDRSFLRLQPIIALITNIDREHLDTYRDLDDIRDAFVAFAQKVPFFGQVILCLDDPMIQGILPRLTDRRLVTYGLTPQADLQAQELELDATGATFQVRSAKEGVLGRVRLPMPGTHNVQNALGALAVGLGLGLPFASLARSFADFGGVHRRFERLGHWRGATVIDDYAHHPTEVKATLQAARQVFGDGRLRVVFQPHLYSRTRDQAEELGRALLAADQAIVTDVYGSRETPLPGVTGELVVAAARASGHRNVAYCADWAGAPALLAGEVRDGDAILTLGAGDVYRLARSLAEEEA